MSNYVKIVDYASKDALASGNPSKAVKGAELGAEFDAIATMSTSKEDKTNKGIASGYAGLDASAHLTAAGFPILTGDVTTAGGALATTISAGAVTLAKMANLAANSIVGNNTGLAATPIALTAAQTKALLAIAAGDVSGLAASATTDTTNASNITTGTLAVARVGGLAASATTDTTNASNISSGTLPAGRLPALTGDVTSTAGSAATTIAAGAVSLSKMANLAANSIMGNNTGVAATPVALTAAQTKSLLAIASGDVSGLAASATTDTTNASNISSGTLAVARMASGYAAANVSGLAASATTDTTNAANITSGRLSATVMPSIPLNSQTAAYILVAGDHDKCVTITTGGVTVNNSVAAAGDAVLIHNDSSSTQTLTQGAGVTLRQSGTTNTGNRTIAAFGMVSLWFKSASECIASGDIT